MAEWPIVPLTVHVDRHEVWSAGWGFYRILRVYSGTGLLDGSHHVATVWGRQRAVARAQQLQAAADNPPPPPKPIFSTAAAPQAHGCTCPDIDVSTPLDDPDNPPTIKGLDLTCPIHRPEATR